MPCTEQADLNAASCCLHAFRASLVFHVDVGCEHWALLPHDWNQGLPCCWDRCFNNIIKNIIERRKIWSVAFWCKLIDTLCCFPLKANCSWQKKAWGLLVERMFMAFSPRIFALNWFRFLNRRTLKASHSWGSVDLKESLRQKHLDK